MALHTMLVILVHGHLRTVPTEGGGDVRAESPLPTRSNEPSAGLNGSATSGPLDEFMLQNSRSATNSDLRKFLFPSSADCGGDGDVNRHFRLFSRSCKVSENCYCDHIKGTMEKDVNTDGKNCGGNPDQGSATSSSEGTFRDCSKHTCACLVERERNSGCLFSDMKPSKILAVVATARSLNVDHVIEAGRFGGLSALVYAELGLSVDSVEYLPLDMVTRALNASGKNISLYNGDDRDIVPKLVEKHQGPKRVGVIFDGSKRFQAYEIYKKIKDQVAFAVFDDADMGAFDKFLNRNEKYVWWSSAKNWREDYKVGDNHACGLEELNQLKTKRIQYAGGLNMVNSFQFAIVFPSMPSIF